MITKIKPPKSKFTLIIGLGRSGFWAAKYLSSKGVKVIVYDSKLDNGLVENQKKLEKIGVKVFLNKPFEYKELSNIIDQLELVIISPGIPLDHPTILTLKELGIKVKGEINIGWENLKDLNWVGITGTNGKTTVTYLLSHILNKNLILAPKIGNIGTPSCQFAHQRKYNENTKWLIAELSSYQLEVCNQIQPKIGIWTTFTPDHLERHKTLENYFNIKNNLIKSSEIRIYNYDDYNLRLYKNILCEGIWITSDNEISNKKDCDYWLDESEFVVERGNRLFKVNEFQLKGRHNIQNLLLAVAAARAIGITGENIKNSLASFKYIPHRMETIHKDKSIEIINDSKATNFDSSIAGINSITGSVIVISGGRLKQGNSQIWVKTLLKKAHSIFLYGESANQLKQFLLAGGFEKDIFVYSELAELIEELMNYNNKEKIETILFSPSCSSFDQFKNFEDRGENFKYLINLSLQRKY